MISHIHIQKRMMSMIFLKRKLIAMKIYTNISKKIIKIKIKKIHLFKKLMISNLCSNLMGLYLQENKLNNYFNKWKTNQDKKGYQRIYT